jgi:exopolysaccharide biosynthesis WecB/TagA/CpsF family protein
MEPMNPRIIQLLGLEFNNTTLAETVKRLLARPHDAHFAYVVTPNADHIVRLRHMPRLAAVYQRALLCLLDSQFIALCADRLSVPRPPVVTGADLTEALLARLDGVTVAVIGMQAGTFNTLAARYPRIHFLHHQPPMELLCNAPAFYQAQEFACTSKAAFTFIALGSPVQELLAYAIQLRREGVGLGLCIGAALEFSAGTAPRAPLWMRRRGLEWLCRLGREPTRLAGRYLITDPSVLLDLAIAAFRQKAR